MWPALGGGKEERAQGFWESDMLSQCNDWCGLLIFQRIQNRTLLEHLLKLALNIYLCTCVYMCMCACIYVHVSIHTYTDDMRGHNLVGHLNKFFFFYRIKRHEGQPETIWYGPCFFELKLGYSTLILILI